MIDDRRNNWSKLPAIVDRHARKPARLILRSHVLESLSRKHGRLLMLMPERDVSGSKLFSATAVALVNSRNQCYLRVSRTSLRPASAPMPFLKRGLWNIEYPGRTIVR